MGTPQRPQIEPGGISSVRQHAAQSALGCPRSSHESHAAQRRGSNRSAVNAAQPRIAVRHGASCVPMQRL
jgi:hypothetical protein